MAFELWRQDDHGHRFRIAVLPLRRQAEEKMRHLMQVPHKQIYWIVQTADDGSLEELRMIKGVLIDLSGTVHLDAQEIPGAITALQRLERSDLRVLFVTNTSRMTRRMLQNLLKDLGYPVPIEKLYTAPRATRRYLETHKLRPYLLIHPHLDEEFADLPQHDPNAVVLGLAETRFDYKHLNRAFRLLLEGAPLLAIGRTRYFEGKEGLQLDAGPFIAALEYAADTQAKILGKPSTDFFLGAVNELGYRPAEVVMIGDDASSDIDGALCAGLHGILVQTGKYRSGDEEKIEGSGFKCARDLAQAVDILLGEEP